jgi:hypothetical protein
LRRREGDVVAVAAEDGVAGAADGIGAEAAEDLQGDLVGGQAAGVERSLPPRPLMVRTSVVGVLMVTRAERPLTRCGCRSRRS